MSSSCSSQIWIIVLQSILSLKPRRMGLANIEIFSRDQKMIKFEKTPGRNKHTSTRSSDNVFGGLHNFITLGCRSSRVFPPRPTSSLGGAAGYKVRDRHPTMFVVPECAINLLGPGSPQLIFQFPIIE